MGARAQQADASLKGSVRLGSYLRRLRSGYGYSLRRVEERARAEGGEIDNSQLSRYEKGICYPSFDKLRVLANVFNVSIQSFSDIVDLEEYEALKPESGTPNELIDHGVAAMKAGDNGRAFALFERAIELLLDAEGVAGTEELLGLARINQSSALIRLGKLALAEQELRAALRLAQRLEPSLQTRALLALASTHADQGDYFLSEIEADRAYQIAREHSLTRLAAKAVGAQARVLLDKCRHAEALERYREAARLHVDCGDGYEGLRTKIMTGACYVGLGKSREGMRVLRETLTEARAAGHRRLEALAWSNLGEAYYRTGDYPRARGCFRESDGLALHASAKHPDILFINAYYEWRMAAGEANPTREKIAFGRLKALRSSLERRFPEVEAFDEYVERGHGHA
jgi:tetratricopeptide (TPR) repeat protein